MLASIAARFIFPGVSLEGRTLWLLRSSPMSMRDLLWAKFWVGTAPLLVLALAIVGVTDYLLKVSAFMFVVSTFTIAMMTFAISGLAIGFGTVFPQFETENAAQIPTSFGGLLFMMASVAVIGAVVVLEARPVFGFLSSRLVRFARRICWRWSFGIRHGVRAVHAGHDRADPRRADAARGGGALAEMEMRVSRANETDIQSLVALNNRYVAQGLTLPRTEEFAYAHLADYRRDPRRRRRRGGVRRARRVFADDRGAGVARGHAGRAGPRATARR